MKERFDLRTDDGRRKLAACLPEFDGQRYEVEPETFVALLKQLSDFLRHPDWLAYHYGMVMLGSPQRQQGPMSLDFLLRLSSDLGRVAHFPRFQSLLHGFQNLPQFHDTAFEASCARLMAELPTVATLEFSPTYMVRGHEKAPEFDAILKTGARVSVECKHARLHEQKAGQRFGRDVEAFGAAMTKAGWPEHMRLEIEFFSHPREQVSQIAERVVSRAVATGKEQIFEDACVRVHVVFRKSPFRTEESGFIAHVIHPIEATSAFNPHFTALRVVNKPLMLRVATSVGATLRSALTQLPVENDCVIFLGGVSGRVAREAIEPKLQDSAYAHVRAFAVQNGDAVDFAFREEERDAVQRIFPLAR